MPKPTTLAKLILAIMVLGVLCFLGYWQAWRRGFVIASADGGYRTRYFIREIPFSTDPFSMILGLNDSYLYRMEIWGFPHCMTDCKTSSGDSYRARTARIDYTPTRSTFYLDDMPWMSHTPVDGWTR